MHQVLQWRLGCNCVVHEGCFEGVILVIADHTGRQCVVAHQVCDDTPCSVLHSLACRLVIKAESSSHMLCTKALHN